MNGLPPNQLRRLFPRASHSFLAANLGREVQDSKPQCDQETTLVPAVQGKEESLGRVTVRFTGYRVKPLDPDNFAGSVKDLLDGLRHLQLVKGDEWWRIKLETDQVKVGHYEEEKTVISLEIYPI